jgi:hypothetical protein
MKPLPPGFGDMTIEERYAILVDDQHDEDRRKRPARARETRFSAMLNDPRPTIRIVAGELSRVVDEAEAALIKAGRPIYQRGGAIVCIEDAFAIDSEGRNVAVQRIVERGDYALAEDLSAAAHFVKFDARVGDDVEVDPPLTIVHTLRERMGRLRLPILTGVINAPTLRADGSILETPGYDARTGLLFDPRGASFALIPDSPTKEDAQAALDHIESLVETFPFVSEVDKSVALSAILTALVRRSLPTAPMHAYTAPVAGSGKGKLVNFASVLTTGRVAQVIAQGADDAELEKRVGAILVAGYSFVSFDNCARPLGGDMLCQMLTEQEGIRIRLLGESKILTLPTNCFAAATGNNLIIAGDLTRRALLCRLDPQCERPETRIFDNDPVAVAEADRPRLVISALTVLRAFHVAGRPRSKPPLGSFEQWSGLVRESAAMARSSRSCGKHR